MAEISEQEWLKFARTWHMTHVPEWQCMCQVCVNTVAARAYVRGEHDTRPPQALLEWVTGRRQLVPPV